MNNLSEWIKLPHLQIFNLTYLTFTTQVIILKKIWSKIFGVKPGPDSSFKFFLIFPTMNWYSIIFAGKNCLNLLSFFLIVWSQENILHRNVWVIFWWIIIFKFNRCACNLILSSFLNINLYYVVTYKRVKELSHKFIIVLSRVITCDQIIRFIKMCTGSRQED